MTDSPTASERSSKASASDTLPERTPFLLAVRGVVQHGDKRGRQLGFPTANLTDPLPEELAFGVYASETEICGSSGGVYRSVSSYGTRPTFEGTGSRLETHILDFHGDIYGRTIAVRLSRFIRAERRFDSVADLVAAMSRDVEAVRDMPASQRPPA